MSNCPPANLLKCSPDNPFPQQNLYNATEHQYGQILQNKMHLCYVLATTNSLHEYDTYHQPQNAVLRPGSKPMCYDLTSTMICMINPHTIMTQNSSKLPNFHTTQLYNCSNLQSLNWDHSNISFPTAEHANPTGSGLTRKCIATQVNLLIKLTVSSPTTTSVQGYYR